MLWVGGSSAGRCRRGAVPWEQQRAWAGAAACERGPSSVLWQPLPSLPQVGAGAVALPFALAGWADP